MYPAADAQHSWSAIAYCINGQSPPIHIIVGSGKFSGLPKRLLPVPDVASHLVCSVCGARNDDLKRPIHARPDARVPGVSGRYLRG